MFDIEVGAFSHRQYELGFFAGLPLVKGVPVGRRGVALPVGIAVGSPRWNLLTDLGQELARPAQSMQLVKGVFVKGDCLWVVSSQRGFGGDLFWRITDCVIQHVGKLRGDSQPDLTIALRSQGLCGYWHAPLVAAYRSHYGL